MVRSDATHSVDAFSWWSVAAFLGLTFVWSWGFWVPEALAARGVLAVPDLPALGAFGPTVAVVLVT